MRVGAGMLHRTETPLLNLQVPWAAPQGKAGTPFPSSISKFK